MGRRLTNNQKLVHFDELKAIAQRRGGRILSTAYVNSTAPLVFEDHAGNIFTMCSSSVKRGYWSPYERNNIREHMVRQAFEYIFGRAFPARNDVVTAEGCKYLQLDGYCEELNIAFEFQGHKSHKSCGKVKMRDQLKRDFCSRNGIGLVIVDEFGKKNDEVVYHHVVEAILKHGIELDHSPNGFTVDWGKINHAKYFHSLWLEKAKEAGYEMLSAYVSSDDPVTWKRLSDGIVFRAMPHSIQVNGWPTLSTRSIGFMKSPEDHLNDLRAIAEKRGGKCLATEWLGAIAKHEFQDADGTIFLSEARNIKCGKWRNRRKAKTQPAPQPSTEGVIPC